MLKLIKVRNRASERIANKKGFTLVEIIVVLVIVAILAAAGIPALLGIIDEARGKAMMAEARVVYVAGQSAASEVYYSDSKYSSGATQLLATAFSPSGNDLLFRKFKSLLGDDVGSFHFAFIFEAATGGVSTPKIKSVFFHKNGWGIKIDAGGTTEVRKGSVAEDTIRGLAANATLPVYNYVVTTP